MFLEFLLAGVICAGMVLAAQEILQRRRRADGTPTAGASPRSVHIDLGAISYNGSPEIYRRESARLGLLVDLHKAGLITDTVFIQYVVDIDQRSRTAEVREQQAWMKTVLQATLK